MANNIDVELMREHLEYQDGQLIRKVRAGNAHVGDIAGYSHPRGYLQVSVCSKAYLAHRIIYAICHGIDPAELHIDHIDGNPSNNHIENLRLATNAQNMQNRTKLPSNNTSSHRGVFWNAKTKKWQVRVQLNGKQIHGGLFTELADAGEKASAMRLDLHGEFARFA